MRPSFNPVMRQMTHSKSVSLYELYHEMAHEVQTRIRCWPFRVWAQLIGLRILGYLATIWLEYDAMRRAQHALEWVGEWNVAMQKEGWTNLMSHIKRKEL